MNEGWKRFNIRRDICISNLGVIMDKFETLKILIFQFCKNIFRFCVMLECRYVDRCS